MDIIIPDIWLRDYLDTPATPYQIKEKLSLSGPSVEKIEGKGKDATYYIEVTTNRVDSASIYGIAREASAILPRFGIKAKLKDINTTVSWGKKPLGIKINNDPKLCKRILAVKLENVKIAPSPEWIQNRLKKVGQRPLNNAIDITNYVMWDVGHPIHIFDYDRLSQKTIIVRSAKKGETLTTLDNKNHTLTGGEVVFDDGTGQIIDLPGIMGTQNTVVTSDTKNVLLWIESIDPVKTRKASMALAIRSQAAVLNEKYVDPELGIPAVKRAVELFEQITKAKIASKLVDIYPNPQKPKPIKLDTVYIQKRLGVEIKVTEIKKILDSLGFKTKTSANKITTTPPSFRAHDVEIPEDIVEEVARIWGYHNLPSELMAGRLALPHANSMFDFENKIKNILVALGGHEVYTLSMVSKDQVWGNALKLKNPLGAESEYLRTFLAPSLVQAAKDNQSDDDPFFIFEMANIYLPEKSKLPEERLMIAGIFANYEYRDAKGIVETLFEKLGIEIKTIPEEEKNYLPSKHIAIKPGNGHFGVLESGFIYYEFNVADLFSHHKQYARYTPIAIYPAQIEDITLELPEKTRVGDIIDEITRSSKKISSVTLGDVYKNAYTFRLSYLSKTKTLTNDEVKSIRDEVLSKLTKKFGVAVK